MYGHTFPGSATPPQQCSSANGQAATAAGVPKGGGKTVGRWGDRLMIF